MIKRSLQIISIGIMLLLCKDKDKGNYSNYKGFTDQDGEIELICSSYGTFSCQSASKHNIPQVNDKVSRKLRKCNYEN